MFRKFLDKLFKPNPYKVSQPWFPDADLDCSLLIVAAAEGNIPKMRQLIAAGALKYNGPLPRYDSDEFSWSDRRKVNRVRGGTHALCAAVNNGHEEAVLLLLNNMNSNSYYVPENYSYLWSEMISDYALPGSEDGRHPGLENLNPENYTTPRPYRYIYDSHEWHQFINYLSPLICAVSKNNTKLTELLTHWIGSSHGALFTAVKNNHLACAKLVVKLADSYEKSYALTIACRQKNQQMIELLVSHGAKSKAALNIAAKEGNIKLVLSLIKNGVKNKDAIVFAANGGHFDVVKTLVEHGWRTPEALVIAAKKGHENIVKFLLEHSYNVNTKSRVILFDLELDSSLYFHEGNIDTRFYLVEKDSIDMKSDNTPLMSAAQKGHANIVKLLLNHGANKDLISLRSGKTALEMAEENNHAESAILLCSKKFTHYQESTATVIDKLEKHPHKIKHAANSHALTEKKTAALTSQIVEAINPQDELPHALSRRHTYK